MKAKFYDVLSMAIDEGIVYGINRAHKHTDTPRVDVLIQEVKNSVMNSLHTWFEFEDNHAAES